MNMYGQYGDYSCLYNSQQLGRHVKYQNEDKQKLLNFIFYYLYCFSGVSNKGTKNNACYPKAGFGFIGFIFYFPHVCVCLNGVRPSHPFVITCSPGGTTCLQEHVFEVRR